MIEVHLDQTCTSRGWGQSQGYLSFDLCVYVRELEDDVTGTVIESRFFSYIQSFYETSVEKKIIKFPFQDRILKE